MRGSKGLFAIVILFALLALVPPATAATRIRQHVHSDAMSIMGQNQPASDDTVTIWLTKDRLAISGGGSDAIVRLDLNQLFILNREKKSYSVIDLPIDLAKMFPADDPNAAMMTKMLEMMKSTTTVTASPETRQVRGWTAHRYDMETKNNFMTVKGVLWATTEAQIDPALYRALQENLMALNPALRDAISSLRKIEGVVVAQEQSITVMGQTHAVSTETLEISEADAPSETFRVPQGYAKEAFDPMANMR
ncbi:MAG: DUF4412 domain-containing protein [Candidatus Eisenbacteria bacterium]|nr:DUF4412 domain-containing protein [Candidatus Eisenbacteria bacterium]